MPLHPRRQNAMRILAVVPNPTRCYATINMYVRCVGARGVSTGGASTYCAREILRNTSPAGSEWSSVFKDLCVDAGFNLLFLPP